MTGAPWSDLSSNPLADIQAMMKKFQDESVPTQCTCPACDLRRAMTAPVCTCRDSNNEGPVVAQPPVDGLHYRYCPLYTWSPDG